MNLSTFSRVNISLGIIVFCFAILGLWIRLLPSDFLMGSIQPIVSSTDPWYTVRQVEQIIRHFPDYSWFDPFLSYPSGKIVDWGPVFPLFTSLFALILNASTQSDIIRAISWAPVILGMVLIPLSYLLGKIVWDDKAGWFASMLISIVGGETLFRSFFGDVDHHLMEVVLTTSFFICYFILLSHFKTNNNKIKGKVTLNNKNWLQQYCENSKIHNLEIVLSIICGILYYLAIMTMPTCTLIAVVIALITFFLPVLLKKKSDYSRIFVMNGIIFGLFIILFAFTGIRVSGWSLGQYSIIHLFIPAGLIAESSILYILMRLISERKKFFYLGILLLVFFALFAFLLLFNSEISNSYIKMVPLFFGLSGTSITIQEMQSTNIVTFIKVFNITSILSFFGFLILCYQFYRTKNPLKLGTIVWALVYIGISLLVVRYQYYSGEIFVIFTSVFLSALYDKIQGKHHKIQKDNNKEKFWTLILINKKAIFWIGLFIIIITILSIPAAIEVGLTETPKDSINDEWIHSLKWLSLQNTTVVLDYYSIYEDTFSYPKNISTVMSWWTSGHWILTLAHKIPSTSPFQDNIVPVAKFLLADSAFQAEMIASQLHVKYVITTNKYLFDDFPMIRKWIPAQSDEDPYYLIFYNRASKTSSELMPMLGMKSSFFNTTIVKLHVNDGSFVSANESLYVSYNRELVSNKEINVLKKLFPLNQDKNKEIFQNISQNQEIISLKYTSPITDTPALQNYRLIYESNGTRTFPGDVTLNNIKIFERVKGYTIPGTGTIEVPIVTNQGRHFTYRQQSVNGTFTLPYATTNSPYDVRATGPYRIIETNQTFDVDESQIEKYYT